MKYARRTVTLEFNLSCGSVSQCWSKCVAEIYHKHKPLPRNEQRQRAAERHDVDDIGQSHLIDHGYRRSPDRNCVVEKEVDSHRPLSEQAKHGVH